MISNEAVQRLIACDRDTLIALMAAAWAEAHPFCIRPLELYRDPDIQALINAAKDANAPPPQWQLRDGKWNKRTGKTP